LRFGIASFCLGQQRWVNALCLGGMVFAPSLCPCGLAANEAKQQGREDKIWQTHRGIPFHRSDYSE
jgi:hypothetical protein